MVNNMKHLHVRWFPDGWEKLCASARKRVKHDAETNYAPTGRSKCKECGKVIAKGAHQVVFMSQCHRGYKHRVTVHMTCAFAYPAMMRCPDVHDFVGVDTLRSADEAAFRARHAEYHEKPPIATLDPEVLSPPRNPLTPTPGSALEAVVRGISALGGNASTAQLRAFVKRPDVAARYPTAVAYLDVALLGGLRRGVLLSTSSSYTVSSKAVIPPSTATSAPLKSEVGADAASSPLKSEGGAGKASPLKSEDGAGTASSSSPTSSASAKRLLPRIEASLRALADRKGSSVMAILRHIEQASAPPVTRAALHKALAVGVDAGVVVGIPAKQPKAFRLA